MNPYKSLSVKNTLGVSFPKGVLQRKTFSLSTGTQHSEGRAFWTVSFEKEKAYVSLASVTSADKRTSKTANAQLRSKHCELQLTTTNSLNFYEGSIYAWEPNIFLQQAGVGIK